MAKIYNATVAWKHGLDAGHDEEHLIAKLETEEERNCLYTEDYDKLSELIGICDDEVFYYLDDSEMNIEAVDSIDAGDFIISNLEEIKL